ncbi:DUF484 family protein [Yoonia sp. 208BN28-4]|uniref:DUF484 family protein n=1 Tax=Yoonia sp. 208BN28-4 TaxID=3126505 RepID=UPI0030B28A2F
MTNTPMMENHVRDQIIADPESLLEDQDIMRALVAANEQSMGSNIVDLRGIAMERLEARLDRLEDTHRSVIAAAYENLAGTNQVHRAVLRMMDATQFENFLSDLTGDVADTLRVDVMRLVLESEAADDPAVGQMGEVLMVAPVGFADDYITRGRNMASRQVTLRQTRPEDGAIYGEKSDFIRSEACLKLDFGAGRLPGMLVMGSEDPHQFTPQQGTDLLTFFAGVFERAMRRWLTA